MQGRDGGSVSWNKPLITAAGTNVCMTSRLRQGRRRACHHSGWVTAGTRVIGRLFADVFLVWCVSKGPTDSWLEKFMLCSIPGLD